MAVERDGGGGEGRTRATVGTPRPKGSRYGAAAGPHFTPGGGRRKGIAPAAPSSAAPLRGSAVVHLSGGRVTAPCSPVDTQRAVTEEGAGSNGPQPSVAPASLRLCTFCFASEHAFDEVNGEPRLRNPSHTGPKRKKNPDCASAATANQNQKERKAGAAENAAPLTGIDTQVVDEMRAESARRHEQQACRRRRAASSSARLPRAARAAPRPSTAQDTLPPPHAQTREKKATQTGAA